MVSTMLCKEEKFEYSNKEKFEYNREFPFNTELMSNNFEFSTNRELNIMFENQNFILLVTESIKKEKYTYTFYQNFYNRLTQMNGIKYMKEIVKKHESIDMNPNIVGGMPTIKGTRIPVSLIIACLRDGMDIEDICKDYNLSHKDIIATLDYVIDLLDTPFVCEGD